MEAKMKKGAIAAVVLAIASLAVGIISRVTLSPLNFIPGGLEANALLAFTNTCLLFAVVLLLWESRK